jgi:hypothetical protein
MTNYLNSQALINGSEQGFRVTYSTPVQSDAFQAVHFGLLANGNYGVAVEFYSGTYLYYFDVACDNVDQFRQLVDNHVISNGDIRLGGWFNRNIRNADSVTCVGLG